MRGEEATTLAKYAVSVLLMVLVISATVIIYNISMSPVDNYRDSLSRSVTSAARDRLDDLYMQSVNADNEFTAQINDLHITVDENNPKYQIALKECNNKHPLCTVAANAIGEFNEDGLVYIAISNWAENHNPEIFDMYTYTGTDTSNISKLLTESVGIGADKHTSQVNGTVPPDRIYKSEHPVSDAQEKLMTYSKSRCHVRVMDIDYGGNPMIGLIIQVVN